jgi:hypothetical protein
VGVIWRNSTATTVNVLYTSIFGPSISGTLAEA